MKICFVLNNHWSAGRGGAEYQALLLMQELEKNNEIFYICRNTSELSEKIISVKGKNFLNKYAYFFDSTRLYKALKKVDPDVVYHRDGGAYTGICAFYCLMHSKKFVWNLAHDKDVTKVKIKDFRNPFKFIDEVLLHYGIKKSQVVISQTVEQQDLLKKNYSISDSIIIPNFHPIPSINRNKNTVKKVLWVANLKKMKRPEIFIDLAKAFRSNESVRFEMVGSADSSYKKLLDEISNDVSNLKYFGCLPQEEVNRLISNSDLFVNTSIAEGFPNTFIQSWLRGTPVMSMCVDPSQVIRNNKIGVMASNLEEMVEVVNRLIESPNDFENMGKNAVKYATQHYSLDNISKIKLLMGIEE